MSVRRSYHTNVKLAAQLGQLDPVVASSIPSSTLHRFRSSDYSDLFGLSVDLEASMDLVRRFAHDKSAQAVFRSALKLKHTLASILSTGRNVTAVLARHKDRIVRLVESVNKHLDERRVLRLLGISRTRYTRLKNQVRRRCPSSIRDLCLRSHPQQLSRSEIGTIRRLMHEERFRGWPVVSIYWRAVRDARIGFALSTFYKYVGRLGLPRAKVASRRKDHVTGIRASRPNELWHADVTVFCTADRLKAFIYFVVDNFSRRILSWAVEPVLSMVTHRATVIEAHQRFIATSSASPPDIITDGGSENSPEYGVPLRHLIAGQDIHFSNSLVESVNKIVKYQSLYLKEIPNIEALRKHLEHWVPVYNDERPHCAHGYLTPTEVHDGVIAYPGRYAEQFEVARKVRVLANRVDPCPICPPKEVSR